MAYIEFDKAQLINLKYSLNKELIRANRLGAYASTSIINCNTRKYHGLLICNIENDDQKHVLLSTVDETIIQNEKEFHISIRKYPNVFHPLGHKYLRDFHTNPIPTQIYRVGDAILQKEIVLSSTENMVMIKYNLLQAGSSTKIRIQPFLAFRNIHSLSKASLDANTRSEIITNGIKSRLFDNYPELYMLLSKENEFVVAPDWHYRIEYQKEQQRGYECQEDLFVPGFFEFDIKQGENVVFAASTNNVDSKKLLEKFNYELKERIPRNSFEECLQSASRQFFIRKNNNVKLIAGFPWYDEITRFTFMALPGLCSWTKDYNLFKSLLKTITKDIKKGLFRNTGTGEFAQYDAVDAPFWFIWALQQYVKHTKEYNEIWKDYKKIINEILNNYLKGTDFNIKIHDNGLVWSGDKNEAVTWMNAEVDVNPITPRIGYAVEVNALWYNAVMFCLDLAKKSKDQKFITKWKPIATKIPKAFMETFWLDEKSYLADFVDLNNKDKKMRPNQLIACSLDYSPIDSINIKAILAKIDSELYTPMGLRSLSPAHKEYKGQYLGNAIEREYAFHQGSVWPWLLSHYIEAYLKIDKNTALLKAKEIANNFEKEIMNHGISTISEIYDGDPPHEARGAISFAPSVAELLRIKQIINQG